VDYSPFAEASQELAFVVFLDLLEEAALFRDAFERWSDAETMCPIDGEKDTVPTHQEDTLTIKDALFDLFLAQGYMLRTKAAGWKLFCPRRGALPFYLWQILPGFKRLQRELNLLDGTPDRPGPAFTPTGMVCWLNRLRPAGNPEITETDIMTTERIADALDVAFRARVEWNGG